VALRFNPGTASAAHREEVPVLGFIALLLVVWLALIVIGAVVEGLFWLIAIGAVLFVATAAFGWVKRNTRV
jgi:phosphotransferase system  glucose/maltose/N-acetylglucosamine-specific IIC component